MKAKVKKYANGGEVTTMGSPTPNRGNAGGAVRGLERAAAMSGRTMPTPGGAPSGMPAAMPAQAQAGLARRPAFADGGKVEAGKAEAKVPEASKPKAESKPAQKTPSGKGLDPVGALLGTLPRKSDFKGEMMADGGEVDDDSRYDPPAPKESMAEATKTVERKASFKEAFASARKAGDKTFEWNGKKFTTEVAQSKPKASERSLSQRLGQEFADVDQAYRSMPKGTSKTASDALTKMRDEKKAAYEKAAESERTGKSVVKLADGGMVRGCSSLYGKNMKKGGK
jgi:hypothetical protein